LHLADGVVGVRNALRVEFPHCLAAIDLMMLDLRDGEPLRFRPFMLVGDPGCGKSRMIRRLAELLSAPMRRYDGSSSGDNAFGGTPKRWSTALPCFPLTCVAETGFANPMLMVDEIDKAPPGYWHGSLHTAMMPFLERETAAKYPDVGFEIEVDVSHVNYCATANDDSRLPKPLKDRLRVIKVPSPGKAQLEMLCASIMKDLAVELNVPAAFLTALAPDELAVVSRAWGNDGSVRKLQKIVRGTVTARDEHASRH
jgi:ATP-dependent Lon protease